MNQPRMPPPSSGRGGCIRFGHQHIAIGQHVDPARMIEFVAKAPRLNSSATVGLPPAGQPTASATLTVGIRRLRWARAALDWPRCVCSCANLRIHDRRPQDGRQGKAPTQADNRATGSWISRKQVLQAVSLKRGAGQTCSSADVPAVRRRLTRGRRPVPVARSRCQPAG